MQPNYPQTNVGGQGDRQQRDSPSFTHVASFPMPTLPPSFPTPASSQQYQYQQQQQQLQQYQQHQQYQQQMHEQMLQQNQRLQQQQYQQQQQQQQQQLSRQSSSGSSSPIAFGSSYYQHPSSSINSAASPSYTQQQQNFSPPAQLTSARSLLPPSSFHAFSPASTSAAASPSTLQPKRQSSPLASVSGSPHATATAAASSSPSLLEAARASSNLRRLQQEHQMQLLQQQKAQADLQALQHNQLPYQLERQKRKEERQAQKRLARQQAISGVPPASDMIAALTASYPALGRLLSNGGLSKPTPAPPTPTIDPEYMKHLLETIRQIPNSASPAAAAAAILQGSNPNGMVKPLPSPQPQPPQVDEADPDATSFQTDRDSQVVFQQYTCKSIPYGRPHPCDVTEAGTLSGVSLPPATYPLKDSLPSSLIEDGLLSSLQLEGILYAAQRHQQFLHSGERAGFFLADGAGVGKGRQIAGMIFDSLLRGNSNKHVWFSVSSDLYLEANRDLNALGCYVRVINGLQTIDDRIKKKNWKVSDLPMSLKEGVLFSTYSTLVSGLIHQRGQRKESRLDQILAWCGGKDFDGLLIFDECHKSKNYKQNADGTAEESSSLTGQAVVRLQAELPRARVVYASATGVTDISNMAYFTRLGLWGAGCGFPDFRTFEQSVKKRGIGAFELLSMELKHQGIYVSRGLSYASCEYLYVDANLDVEQEEIYNAAAHFWLDLKDAFHTAINMTGSEKSLWKIFWSSHQRFFGALTSSAKVGTIVDETKRAISEGYAVVIGLQSTGESSMAHEEVKDTPQPPQKKLKTDAYSPPSMVKDEVGVKSELKSSTAAASSTSTSTSSSNDRNQFPSLFREMLCRFLRNHFPVYPYVKPPPKKPSATAGTGKRLRGQAKDLEREMNDLGMQMGADGVPIPIGGGGPIIIDDEVLGENSRPSTPNSGVEAIDAPIHPHHPLNNQSSPPKLDPSQPIPAALQMRDDFLARVATLLLPTSPLDELIDRLGGREVVAEMTGRQKRFVRHAKTGKIILETRGGGGSGGKGGSRMSADDATTDINIAERNLFMSGEKLVAIISDAASTGISLHADRAVKNQRKRMHITMELPWSADKAIQQLGRTHRSNEVTGVVYALVISSLGGERRFASACAARLQSLGALTKGDRRAGTGSNLAQYDLDTDYGRKALRSMVTNIWQNTTALNEDALNTLQVAGLEVLPDEEERARLARLDHDLLMNPPSYDQLLTHLTYVPHPQPWSQHNCHMFRECLESMGFNSAEVQKVTVKSFLNRILGLPVAKQNLLFEYFMMVLNHSVLLAKKEGTYNEAVSDLTAESITIAEQRSLTELIGRTTIAEEKEEKKAMASFQSTKNEPNINLSPVVVDGGSKTLCTKLSLDRGISLDAAKEILNNLSPDQQSTHSSFYLGTHPVTGATMPLLAIKKANSAYMFQVMRPNSGRATFEMSKTNLLRTYNRATVDAISKPWQELYELTLNHCTHGPKCKMGVNCSHGRRVHFVHLLGGHVLSYLSDLSKLTDQMTSQITFNERQLKVVRVDCDDGQRLVGLQVSKLVLNRWQDELKMGTLKVSNGLGVPASYQPPQPLRPELLKRFTTPPHLLSTPSFFGGTSAEAEDHKLMAGAQSAHIASSSSHEAAPHQLTPHKHLLHNLVGTSTPSSATSTAAAASFPSIAAKKQTSLSSFFGVKSTVGSPNSSAKKASSMKKGGKPASTTLTSFFAAPSSASSKPSSSQLKLMDDDVIDLLSESDNESQPNSKQPTPSSNNSKKRARSPARSYLPPSTLNFSTPTAASSSSPMTSHSMANDEDDFLESPPAGSSGPLFNPSHHSPSITRLEYSEDTIMTGEDERLDEIDEDLPILPAHHSAMNANLDSDDITPFTHPTGTIVSDLAAMDDMPPLCY